MTARVVGLLVIVALAGGLVAQRCAVSGRHADTKLDDGLRALRTALETDGDGFGRARRSFAEAAGGVVFEPYPLFALEVVGVLSEARERPDALERVAVAARPTFQAWLDGRLEDALVAAARLPVEDGVEMLARLARDLVRVKSLDESSPR